MHPPAFLPPASPLPHPSRPPNKTSTRPHMTLNPTPALKQSLAEWGVNIDKTSSYATRTSAIKDKPPLLRVEQLLTHEQCRAIIARQRGLRDESDLYLNYRVNREVQDTGGSAEAQGLIGEFESARVALDHATASGFRVAVEPTAVELAPVLDAVCAVLGWKGREVVFEEGAWVRPSVRRVVVRDVTTVRYEVGEGVAPHVDGKDLTVLICLQEPVSGGRTVFPQEGLAVVPKDGVGIFYRSRKELLHFAERVDEGEKWVLQLLIDFRVRADEMDVDYGSGEVFV